MTSPGGRRCRYLAEARQGNETVTLKCSHTEALAISRQNLLRQICRYLHELYLGASRFAWHLHAMHPQTSHAAWDTGANVMESVARFSAGSRFTFWLKLVFRRKKRSKTSGGGWGIVIELFRLLREITLWSHFYRGIENTCLDRARDGRCGRLLPPA